MNETATVQVRVNGEARVVAAPASVLSLLRELGLDGRKGVAAAINGEVVPRSRWSESSLGAADEVLVIRATQGG